MEGERKKWQQCKLEITCSRYVTCYPVMERRKVEEEAEEKVVTSIKLSP